jgi:NAD(P)-dependent dehydrogenase (short-subunit alcohol dehydrogenase family)
MLVPADVEALIESAGSLRVPREQRRRVARAAALPGRDPRAVGRHARPQPALGDARDAARARADAPRPRRRDREHRLDGRPRSEPYESPEYGAAKAGLIRFTAALREVRGVRVACVVPDWIRTERAEAELAAMTPEERAAAPEPLPLEALTDAVVALVRDDASAGRVVVLRGGDG